MQHGRQDRVRCMVSRDVQDGDPRLLAAPLKVFNDVALALRCSQFDSGVEIETLFEVDINDMVASNSVQRNSIAVDIDSPQRRDLSRKRHNVLDDIAEVLDLIGQDCQTIRILRTLRYFHVIPPNPATSK